MSDQIICGAAETKLSNTQIAKVYGVDTSDCTDAGWIWQLYSDGRVSCEYWSCWSGSTTGQRYTTDSGWIDVAAIGDGPDAATAALEEAVAEMRQDEYDSFFDEWPLCRSDFRKTRNGHLIR